MNSNRKSTKSSLWQWVPYVLLLAVVAGLIALAMSSKPRLEVRRDDSALWRPRLATPAIVALDSTNDREFTAEIKASPSASDWKAELANDFRSWPCEIVSATYATINNNSELGWRVKISVPADTSPELFTLTVSSSEGTSVQVQAVSVITDFAKDFYILHITDEQIVNQFPTDPSGQFHHGVGTWQEMLWMQQPVNLINPRFVLITGDQIDYNGALDGWNNWSNWNQAPQAKRKFTFEETSNLEIRLSEMYKDCHQGYHVAYVETPGNHDVTPPGKKLSGTDINWHPISTRIYEEQFGQRSYSFRMGDFYMLMHDWSDESLEHWAVQDYQAALDDPTIKYRVIGQHYNAKWNGAPTGNYPFAPASCDLMLIGHGHRTKTVQTSPYYIYMDRAAFFWGTAGFFNFRRTDDGWNCDQTASLRDENKDVWGMFTDNGAVKKVRADQPDTRNITTNSVTITNDLPEDFYDGRVRFVLPKGRYDRVANGKVLAEYDSMDKTKTIVLVRVDIPANGSVTVSIPEEEMSGLSLGQKNYD